MNLVINGEAREVSEGLTISELLESMELSPKRVAVERNQQLIRRGTFTDTPLTDGDKLEIVTLVGGG